MRNTDWIMHGDPEECRALAQATGSSYLVVQLLHGYAGATETERTVAEIAAKPTRAELIGLSKFAEEHCPQDFTFQDIFLAWGNEPYNIYRPLEWRSESTHDEANTKVSETDVD